MPVFKPGGTIPIVLDSDAMDDQPLTFVCIALSVNQANDLGSSLDELVNTPMTHTDRQAKLIETLTPLVKEFKNTDATSLGDFHETQLWALAWSIKRQIGYQEKKA
jgi:hypothetical protein